MPKLETLEEFVRTSPDEPLPRYALAMEYRNLERHQDAIGAFRELLARRPEYVPTYLMLAQTLIGVGLPDEARPILELGITVARKAGNRHAAGELQDALDALE